MEAIDNLTKILFAIGKMHNELATVKISISEQLSETRLSVFTNLEKSKNFDVSEVIPYTRCSRHNCDVKY